MDERQFDRLARACADGLTRRRLLRALTGGTVGLLLEAAGAGHARAENDAAQFCLQLPPGERGKCRAAAAAGNPDGLFAQCEGDPNRLCAAPDGSVDCCIPPQTCGGGGTPGACGCTPTKTTCAPGECGVVPDGCGGTVACDPCPTCHACEQGACRPLSDANDPRCGANEGCCGGACVDLTDDVNCGSCGNSCADGRICREGGCCQPSIGSPCEEGGCCWGLCGAGVCRFAAPGEPCDEDADCASSRCDPSTQKCTLLGASCSNDAGCEPGQTCFAGTCRCCSNFGPNRGPGWCEMPDGSRHNTIDICCTFPRTALVCCPQDGSPGFSVCCDGLICPPCDGGSVHTGTPFCGGACTDGCGCTLEGGSCTGDAAGASTECCSGICCGGSCCGPNAHGCEGAGACFF